MPDGSSSPRRSTEGVFGLPLWLRFALSLGVVVILGVALVLFVEDNGPDTPASSDPAAVVRANREAEILVSQDQAPHVVRLSGRGTPAKELEHAVRSDIADLISTGQISGPLGRVACTPTAARASARRGFRCSVVADQVSYPFLGVVDTRTRRIIYCKRDPPPVPSENVPVSSRCLG
jgi:hypothetical protein